MTNTDPFSASIIPFEVPEQMRAFAEKGVSQARDSYAKFKAAAETHTGTIEFGMIEEGRSCIDLAQQLHAVEKAVSSAKRELIHDHIEHCLDDGDRAGTKASLKELKQLAKYL